MAKTIKTILVTKEESKIPICESCGNEIKGSYRSCGRSLRRITNDKTDPTIVATWCPNDYDKMLRGKNPTITELKKLREILLQEQSNEKV